MQYDWNLTEDVLDGKYNLVIEQFDVPVTMVSSKNIEEHEEKKGLLIKLVNKHNEAIVKLSK
jgi:hypothetical protein